MINPALLGVTTEEFVTFITDLLKDYYSDVIGPTTNFSILGIEKAIFTVMFQLIGLPDETKKQVLTGCIKHLDETIATLEQPTKKHN